MLNFIRLPAGGAAACCALGAAGIERQGGALAVIGLGARGGGRERKALGEVPCRQAGHGDDIPALGRGGGTGGVAEIRQVARVAVGLRKLTFLALGNLHQRHPGVGPA